jgi:DnaJ family protein C protein 19
MLWLLLGAFVLFLLMGGMRAFERASVTSIKALFAWVAALGGLSLALMLILTGRGGVALGALTLFGPLIYQRWQAAAGRRGNRRAGGAGGASAGSQQGGPGAPRTGAMSRSEAYEVLGLRPNATEAEIRDAHRRLMRAAHPDTGGSDWLAARINQARDILLG